MLYSLHSMGTSCPSGCPANLQGTQGHFGHKGWSAAARHTYIDYLWVNVNEISNSRQTETLLIYLFLHTLHCCICECIYYYSKKGSDFKYICSTEKHNTSHKRTKHSTSPIIREPSPAHDMWSTWNIIVIIFFKYKYYDCTGLCLLWTIPTIICKEINIVNKGLTLIWRSSTKLMSSYIDRYPWSAWSPLCL